MAPRRKQQWKIGDVFVVRNADGKYTPGQTVGREAQALNSVTVAFYDAVLEQPEPPAAIDFADPFSVIFATRDLLDEGSWHLA
ncbi:MAG TPA: hypothetical protein VN947_01835 [Polyangia bacterium]|nr:hypothetical protein [Polyangia bacterium]